MKHKIAIISCAKNEWGGSEDLWYNTALELVKPGHDVLVFKRFLNKKHPKITPLTRKGIRVFDIYESRRVRLFRVARGIRKIITSIIPRQKYLDGLFESFDAFERRIYQTWNLLDYLAFSFLYTKLKLYQPDLILINQGDNFDGYAYMLLLRKLALPYVILSQKTSEIIWPSDEIVDNLRSCYQDSLWNFFVSKHNHQTTELQIGLRLEKASIVLNPIKVNIDKPLNWLGSTKQKVRLACIGRMWVLDKAQNILLQVLALDKWKTRNISVSFFGTGPHLNGLKRMAAMLELTNITFPGYVTDIKSLWEEHHALILPSYSEGMPLVVLEAMFCGRPVIANAVAGVPEVIQDNYSGFLSYGVSVEALDEVMERAWENFSHWEEMGKNGAEFIRNFPLYKQPNNHLAKELCDMITKCQNHHEISA